jgi:co-chaperonin GroES (HSP10)
MEDLKTKIVIKEGYTLLRKTAREHTIFNISANNSIDFYYLNKDNIETIIMPHSGVLIKIDDLDYIIVKDSDIIGNIV